ncbi:hypothetical protein GCM10010252_01520 [Streptomyces aureoverticillatus]|nr:hypothetical protein GCM10010252_01520 [Streptomyces aureoverticillatus]
MARPQTALNGRPGGTVVVTTRPWRERGELIDLPSAVLAAGQAAGLTPAERCVALLAGIRDSRLINRPSFFQMKNVRDARHQGIPLAVIQHEDVLVFTRPEHHTKQPATTQRRPGAPARGQDRLPAHIRSRPPIPHLLPQGPPWRPLTCSSAACSPGSAAWTSPSRPYSAAALPGTRKATRTRPATGPIPPTWATSRPSTGTTLPPCASSPLDSPARTSPSPALVPDSPPVPAPVCGTTP